MAALERMLVPVDFSACSKAALDFAAFLAGKLGAGLDLVHVIESIPYFEPEASIAPSPGVTTSQGQIRDRVARDMEELIVTLKLGGIDKVRPRIETGEVHSAILKIAEEGNYDLIVMGTHGRTGLQRLIMGSVAEKIVRMAPCPVLTLRAQEKETRADERKSV